ncbi:MAG: site-2 protease family protein [Candidatus Omnitrophica bacterium]|nr:site-2 protease family protein [Candidatus Omnitrophota bacterium]
MGLASLLFKNPALFLVISVPILYSVIAHEIAHGWVAYMFGDDTARRSGRLSLNPFKHLDPIGTLALFLVGFGWARPVPITYSNLRSFRIGLVSVSLAGCIVNIAIATMSISLLQFTQIRSNPLIAVILVVLARINILLGSLNLIPIPPLDGSRVLMGILPPRAQIALARLEPYGMLILLGLLFTGLLDPVIITIQNVITTIIKTILRI